MPVSNFDKKNIKHLCRERLPVLLFVHGDGYETGTGAAFDGAVFASYSKSIVVTINYRLGPFGKRNDELST
jgi:carboxylesterase type B